MVGLCSPNRRRGGFATAELLVGALIVLILFIAASPFYRAAKAEASRQRCLAARRLIATAQEQYRAHSPGHAYARNLSELKNILPVMPRCPDGGFIRCRLPNPEIEPDLARDARLVILCTEEGHRPYVAP